jgi:hypothetical protein
VFFDANFMLVKHFSKTGRAKTGDNHQGWKERFMQWFFWGRHVAEKMDCFARARNDDGGIHESKPMPSGIAPLVPDPGNAVADHPFGLHSCMAHTARAILLPVDPPLSAIALPPAHMLVGLHACGRGG